MTAPTPQQMRALAAVVEAKAAYYKQGPGFLEGQTISVLRAAADELERFATIVAQNGLPSCGFDTEQYATAYNAGYDAAVTQSLVDHPAAYAAALRQAAENIEQEAGLMGVPENPEVPAAPGGTPLLRDGVRYGTAS